MKVLFLVFGPAIVASSRTRIFQYLPLLKREGIRCKVIVNSTGLSYYLIKYFQSNTFFIKAIRFLLSRVIQKCDLIFSSFQVVRFTFLAIFYDILFIQKVLIPTCYIKLLKRVLKKTIIFDFDDALYASEIYNKHRFNEQLPLFKLIVLENSFTKQYVSQFTNSDILKIAGPVDCNRYHPKERCNNGKW